MKVLLTTTSFQDTPGPHHDKLLDAGFELICERGPLPESKMLQLVGLSANKISNEYYIGFTISNIKISIYFF